MTLPPRRGSARSTYPRNPASRAELSTLDRELSTLYDRLLAAQEAAEMAGVEGMAANLRILRAAVHARLVELAGQYP